MATVICRAFRGLSGTTRIAGGIIPANFYLRAYSPANARDPPCGSALTWRCPRSCCLICWILILLSFNRLLMSYMSPTREIISYCSRCYYKLKHYVWSNVLLRRPRRSALTLLFLSSRVSSNPPIAPEIRPIYRTLYIRIIQVWF